MILNKIQIENFRNLKHISFEPSQELTVICGENGQGKTNLLEAIWLLTGAKSFRGAKDVELLPPSKKQAVIQAYTTVAQGIEKEISLSVSLQHTQKTANRTAIVNDVPYGRASNIAGIFSAVVFQPGHLKIIQGSPEMRRNFLDAAICQIYPMYLALLRRYQRQITQKNALLKSYDGTKQTKDLLDIYDLAQAQFGQEIIKKRQDYLQQMIPEICQSYAEISSNREVLTVHYQASLSEHGLLESIQNSRSKDIKAGFCTVGPHREDIQFFLNEKEVKIYGSQGQQRSVILSLKLAEAACVLKITGEHPVILFDDVLSELDEQRQKYLLSKMAHRQIFVTACDQSAFDRTNGHLYMMKEGVLSTVYKNT